MQSKSPLEIESCLAEYYRKEIEAMAFTNPGSKSRPIPDMRQKRQNTGERDALNMQVRRRMESAESLIIPEVTNYRPTAMPSVVPSVRFVEMPDMDVASVRFIGHYRGLSKPLGVLYKWAGPKGLLETDPFVFSALYDVPGTVPEAEMRSDASICVSPDVETKPPVYFQRIKCAGRYAIGHFEFRNPQEFPRHWYEMCVVWLPKSGFQFDDRPMLERYQGDPMMRDGIFRVDICIPIKAL